MAFNWIFRSNLDAEAYKTFFWQVRTLEERLTEARRSEAIDYEKEARKFKLKYEILARNEINKKVSELNDFLGQRAKDQEVNRSS